MSSFTVVKCMLPGVEQGMAETTLVWGPEPSTSIYFPRSAVPRGSMSSWCRVRCFAETDGASLTAPSPEGELLVCDGHQTSEADEPPQKTDDRTPLAKAENEVDRIDGSLGGLPSDIEVTTYIIMMAMVIEQSVTKVAQAITKRPNSGKPSPIPQMS